MLVLYAGILNRLTANKFSRSFLVNQYEKTSTSSTSFYLYEIILNIHELLSLLE